MFISIGIIKLFSTLICDVMYSSFSLELYFLRLTNNRRAVCMN